MTTNGTVNDMRESNVTSRKTTHRIIRLTAFCFLLFALCLLPSAFCLSAHAQGWTKQQSGTLAWLRAVYFLDAETGWAVGGSGALFKTTDGGRRWQPARRPSEDILRDVYFSDASTGWLVCERSIYLLKTNDEPRAYLLKTTDGGASWKRVLAAGTDVDARLVRIVFADAQRGWVFGEAGALYTTADGGATWTRQRTPTRHLLLGGAFVDAQHGWLVGAGATILQTSDGGTTWNAGQIERATLSTSSNPNASPSNPPTSTAPNANIQNADAPNANASTILPASAASPANTSPRLNAVSFVDARRGWAVGASGAVFTTINAGRTWRAQNSNTNADLFDVKFFDPREGWAVGTGGTAIHTTDGGATWRVEPTGTTHPLERLHFVTRARGWAVGYGGTIIAYR